ncbi:MAG: GC-type dockerin domain-anchored protein [Phycisphaerales bacterium]
MRFTKPNAAATALALLTTAGLASAQNFSGTLGTPGFTGSYVSGMTVHDDGSGESLFVVGSFSIAGGGSTGTQVARWDGAAWQSVGGGLQGGYTNAAAEFQGDLIVAGYFDTADGVAGSAKLARWDGAAWNAMDAQSEIFLNSMWDLEVYDDGITGEQLYIAGNYGALNGQAGLDHIAKWDGSNYTGVGGTIGGAVPLIVLDLHQTDLGGGNNLYAGGRFLTMGGIPALNVAEWDGSSWKAMDLGVSRTSGFAQVLHMTSWDDGSGEALYVGGRFNLAGGVAVSQNIAKWDGMSWSDMGDGFDGDVHELVVFDDGSGEALYALGNFSNSGATPIAGVARWNGTDWEAVSTSVNGSIFTGIVYDAGEGEALIIGGGFSNISGTSANRVVSLLAAGCPADLNGDGVLDFFDISAFLTAYGNMDPIADFNDDGIYDFFDISAFLSAYGAGCP